MAIKIPDVITLDFETKGIKRRPRYPPLPVSLSIQFPEERAPTFYAWGHPEGNNCTIAKVRQILRDVARRKEPILCQNGKFDYDVAITHLSMPELDWRRIHDTLYLLFLENPHAKNLSLKPSAERLLGMKPDERDDVYDWIIAHKHDIEARTGERVRPSEAGAFISEVPAQIVKAYCNGDVIRTLRLFRKLYPIIHRDGMLGAYDRERQLMPILLRNEQEGIRVDMRKLAADVKLYRGHLETADRWLRKRLKVPDLNVNSDQEVANALDNAGIVTEWNPTATGKRSVSKKNLTVDMFNDAKVASTLGYRNRLSTCLGTFMEPWLEMAQETGGRIHTNWNQVRNSDSGKGARTGRMSSNPNFQNIPTDWYGKSDGYAFPKHLPIDDLPLIRRYVLPDAKDHLIGHRDYNQQEWRITAHFENGRLLQAYIEDPTLDVHSYVGQEIFNIVGVRFERKPVKVLNFGMLYGMGINAIASKIDCPTSEARKLRNAQQRAIPDVVEMDRGIKAAAKAGDPIRTWGGRLYYCEQPLIIDGKTVTWEYKLLNYLIQGSAADCTKQAIINYDALKKEGRFMLSVHDESNISAPKQAIRSEMKLLNEAMSSVAFDVPMRSDGKTGPNWATLKKE